MTVTLAYITFISLAHVGTQLIDAIFSEAVRVAVAHWKAQLTLDQVVEWLSQPVELGRTLLPAIEHELNKHNFSCADVKEYVWAQPFLRLSAVFEPGDLPNTPIDFCPVPMAEGSVIAQLRSLALRLSAQRPCRTAPRIREICS